MTTRPVKLRSTSTSEPMGRRLRNGEFTDRPWRIHEMADDFRVLDVWQLPTPGGPDDLSTLVELLAAGVGIDDAPRLVAFVWSVRWAIGKCLHWDGPQHGIGVRMPSLNARLPEDIADAPIGPDFNKGPFTPVYLLPDEFAAEVANSTCHGVLHLGWVKTEYGCWTGQLTVLVKPNGIPGRVYLAGIQPFRHTLIYPAMLRGIERAWRTGAEKREMPLV